ncbi:MAG TPA: hypothetical protein DIU15_06900 [Deltaproteobacteria bacterium]|mgnify:CR=1 FL=1|nr:hypothetical protein [Deltaproteobacteria bacterium]HCP45751.1 hypothetical protein [Deltaproteobacteria bacterium]
MKEYLIRRAALAAPLLIVVFTSVFLLVHLIPGDPVDFMIGENAALDRKAELRRTYHLDKPILVSTRPWFGKNDAERLLSQTGSLAQSPTIISVQQQQARQQLEDTGRWAVLPLLQIWQDSQATAELRERARQGIVLAAGTAGPQGERNQRLLSTLLLSSRNAKRAEELIPPWVQRNRLWFDPPPSQRLLASVTETQYALFVRDLIRGDVRSLHSRQPILTILSRKFAHTLVLAMTALLVAIAVAIPLGTLAAYRPYSWVDNGSMLAALFGISMPNFWLGPLLILVFSIELGWFPVSGAATPAAIVLPAITLGLGMSAILTRITRASVLETVGTDYVRTARAKGLQEWRVLVQHALRTALIPIVTILGLQFGALLAGSIITEEIFGWPGIGRALIQAIRSRDFPMVQGCVLLVAGTYVVVNTATDVLYRFINPRVRLG